MLDIVRDDPTLSVELASLHNPDQSPVELVAECLEILKQLAACDQSIPKKIVHSTDPNPDRLVRKGSLYSILLVGQLEPITSILATDPDAFHSLVSFEIHCSGPFRNRSRVRASDIALGLETIRAFVPPLERYLEENQRVGVMEASLGE
jgi:hypothetical protein